MGAGATPEPTGDQRPDYVGPQSRPGVYGLLHPCPVLNTSTGDNCTRDGACLEGKALTVLPGQVRWKEQDSLPCL